MSLRWDIQSLRRCWLEAQMSKDPSSRVGAVIVGPDLNILSTGFNGFPRGVTDDGRLQNKEVKRKIIVHAELNAILNAAREGVRLKGSTLYWIGIKNGKLWGGCPCVPCTSAIIQAGIAEIVSISSENMPDTWALQQPLAHQIRTEGHVDYHQYSLEVFQEKFAWPTL